jgi:hypothetical protein
MMKNITDAGISVAEWEAFCEEVARSGGTCGYDYQSCSPSPNLESCLNCVLEDRIDRQ